MIINIPDVPHTSPSLVHSYWAGGLESTSHSRLTRSPALPVTDTGSFVNTGPSVNRRPELTIVCNMMTIVVAIVAVAGQETVFIHIVVGIRSVWRVSHCYPLSSVAASKFKYFGLKSENILLMGDVSPELGPAPAGDQIR